MRDEQTPADVPTNPALSPTDEMMLDMMDMADIAVGKHAPINPVNAPTDKATSKKTSPTKKKNSQTMKKGAGLNKVKQDELLKWTVFVQAETKNSVGKAASKAGVTVTDWVDSRLREAATIELTNKPKPPAKVEDVADLMSQFEKRLADQQAEAQKAQSDQIQELAAAIKNQPSNLKEWLFGKPKKD